MRSAGAWAAGRWTPLSELALGGARHSGREGGCDGTVTLDGGLTVSADQLLRELRQRRAPGRAKTPARGEMGRVGGGGPVAPPRVFRPSLLGGGPPARGGGPPAGGG